MASAEQKKVLLINGPNINLLGTREPEKYGTTTLPQIISGMTDRAPSLGIELSHFQSNHEGAIVDRIQDAHKEGVHAIIINPAAYTHTSVAIRDALLSVNIPFIELHVTNVHAREEWRKHSYFTDKARAIIAGLGAFGYVAALEYWAWAFDDGPKKGIGKDSKS